MEAVSGKNILKTVRFLTLNLFILFFCISCNQEIDNNPKISLSGTESVTANSAILVASLTTPDKPLIALFEYFDNGAWQKAFTETYPANQTIVVKKEMRNLTQGKVYQYRVSAGYLAYSDNFESYTSVLTATGTKEFKTLDQSIINLSEVKIGLTTLSLKINIVPNLDNTKVQVDYTTNGTTLSKLSDFSYSGHTTQYVNFVLDNLTKNTDYQIKIKALNSSEVVLDTIIKTGAVVDYDGNIYHIVTIGSQVWLQENFKGTHFANGDPILNITDQSQWEAATNPAFCYYNNDIKYASTYGVLYNWYVACDSRELISGFHVPNEADLNVLLGLIRAPSPLGEGLSFFDGGKIKEAGFAHWIHPNKGANNSTGFTALPAGGHKYTFGGMGEQATFWTSSFFFNMTNVGCCYTLYYAFSDSGEAGDPLWVGYSIRIVKN